MPETVFLSSNILLVYISLVRIQVWRWELPFVSLCLIEITWYTKIKAAKKQQNTIQSQLYQKQ